MRVASRCSPPSQRRATPRAARPAPAAWRQKTPSVEWTIRGGHSLGTRCNFRESCVAAARAGLLGARQTSGRAARESQHPRFIRGDNARTVACALHNACAAHLRRFAPLRPRPTRLQLTLERGWAHDGANLQKRHNVSQSVNDTRNGTVSRSHYSARGRPQPRGKSRSATEQSPFREERAPAGVASHCCA